MVNLIAYSNFVQRYNTNGVFQNIKMSFPMLLVIKIQIKEKVEHDREGCTPLLESLFSEAIICKGYDSFP